MNTFMRFPEGKIKALTLSYDDGVYQDIRLADILTRNGIKATFNVNSETFNKEDNNSGCGRLSAKQLKQTYQKGGHEVAVHSATHPFLEELPLPIAIDEVLRDRKNLEKEFGTIVRGMAYPFGTYNDALVEGLKNIGIAYSRTVISTNRFDMPNDWLRLPATCHHNSKELPRLCDEFLNIKSTYKPRLFYLWGHSYEFDDNDNWNVIEEFADKMGNKDDIWYAANIEIYDYVQAYKRLIFSVETRKVYNPNSIPVWFACGQLKDLKTVKVEPGETLEF